MFWNGSCFYSIAVSVHTINDRLMWKEVMDMDENLSRAAAWLEEAGCVLVGASNGLSIAEGYHIFADNDDFKKYFGYFRDKYGIGCLIRGVFADIPEHERYMAAVRRYLIEEYAGSRVMKDLLQLLRGKEYFIVTSNADTHFQMNGFDAGRIFEIEGNFAGTDMYGAEWYAQQERFRRFLEKYGRGSTLVLELGIGMRNTLIKKPLMDMAAGRPSWRYAVLNMPGQIYVPAAIAERTVCLPGDMAATFEAMLAQRSVR